jgi:hypothetical protein
VASPNRFPGQHSAVLFPHFRFDVLKFTQYFQVPDGGSFVVDIIAITIARNPADQELVKVCGFDRFVGCMNDLPQIITAVSTIYHFFSTGMGIETGTDPIGIQDVPHSQGNHVDHV